MFNSEINGSHLVSLINLTPCERWGMKRLSPVSACRTSFTHLLTLDTGAASSSMDPYYFSNGLSSMEQRINAQYAEIQWLLNENRQLTVTHVALKEELAKANEKIMQLQKSQHVYETEKAQCFKITQIALRQELADSKQEVSKLQEELDRIRVERDQHIRANMERTAYMEMTLKVMESLRDNFDKVQFDKGEIIARLEHLSAKMKVISVKDEKIAALKQIINELHEKQEQDRMDLEMQKKLNLGYVEHQEATEKHTLSMSRGFEISNDAEREHNGTWSGQWNESSSAVESKDAAFMPQEKTQHINHSTTLDICTELTPCQHEQPKLVLQDTQAMQQSVKPVPVQPSIVTHAGGKGVNLLVMGLPEGISDRDLAILFHPYGAIFNAKVMVNGKSGHPQFSGMVTMENVKAAEAAVHAVSGMYILGQRIRVEIQSQTDTCRKMGQPHHQLQQAGKQGGVGPVRHHQVSGPSAHWPY
ncbi:hypothetical protein KP509_36G058000 [Ceratopteris richardii]|uniref:RRM domain-containing protein n=1 Tax=Ceratopteris richardii TaxID=49495 RepID=A0A8T2QDB0_CERRI|nr:hypothetical protein KP509_36G058000 [Ceratopteris richardii]KAH7281674.1 hypothetical protein KP509_36G058000 [Ceratopteris richardii]